MKNSIHSIDQFLGTFWVRIKKSTSVDPECLSIYRIVAGLFILLLYTPYHAWLGTVPKPLFDPPALSLANLFEAFPPVWFFHAADCVLLLAAFCLTCGVRSRIAGVTFCVTKVVVLSFYYSFGKIDHDIMLFVAVGCCSLSNWGTRFALVPDRAWSPRWDERATGLLGVLLAFGLLTAGLEKAYVWIDFDLSTSGFLAWLSSGFYSLGRDDFLAPYLLNLPPVAYEFFDYSAVCFELLGLCMLVAGRFFWRSWLCLATCFHLCNLLFLNIMFENLIPVYSAFLLPMILWKTGLVAPIGDFLRGRFGWVCGGVFAICCLHLYSHFIAEQSWYLLSFLPNETEKWWMSRFVLMLWGSLFVVSTYVHLLKTEERG